MDIDPATEHIFSFQMLGRRLSLHRHTLRKYHVEGRRSARGVIRKMAAVRMPYGLGSSLEAYYRFLEELNDDEQDSEGSD